MSDVLKRFLNYLEWNTQSKEDSNSIPSTPGQMSFAVKLEEELKQLGLEEVKLDKNGYIMATLPANIDKETPIIGFIAHMDTSPDMSSENVKPQIIEDYNGEDILINSELNIRLSPKDFPELKEYIGETLVATDGTTLLGADDKAGIAEIITAVDYLIGHPQIKHGKVRIGFTPDEEVGRGADLFNVEEFGADFAFTIDGGPVGELEYENFNAAKAAVKVRGRNVHPGTAKGKMINSILLANEYISLLPRTEIPSETEGYEGFYHLTDITGEVEETVLNYILRDFDKESFEKRKETMKNACETLNQKYGVGTFTIDLKDQYFNMKEKIEPVKHIVDIAYSAIEAVGVLPRVSPIRGGTDGARLSFMGLPTPNVFTGGHNFHGKYEFIPVFAMEKAVEVILKIIEFTAAEKN